MSKSSRVKKQASRRKVGLSHRIHNLFLGKGSIEAEGRSHGNRLKKRARKKMRGLL